MSAFTTYWKPSAALGAGEVAWLCGLNLIVGLFNPTIGVVVALGLALTRLRRNQRARLWLVVATVVILALQILVNVGYEFWPGWTGE